MEKQSDAIALSTDDKSLEETKATIFGIEFKKFKENVLLWASLLCLPFVLLFVAHLAFGADIFQMMGLEKMRRRPVGLGNLLCVASLVPLIVLPLSLLHMRSRESIYKVWLMYSGLGLILLIWALFMYLTIRPYNDLRVMPLFLVMLAYSVGSIAIWLYGAPIKSILEVGKLKKSIFLGSAILSIPALSLLIPTLFGINPLRSFPVLRWIWRNDLFGYFSFIPLVVLPLSLLHYKSRETIYKIWLGYSLLGLVLFIGALVMNIIDPPGSGLGGPNLAGVEFVLLGIVYTVGSILIWLFSVVTEKNAGSSIFGIEFKKFKKGFLFFNALLLVAGGCWYLTLFVPYWMSSIDYRTLRLKLIALGLRDTFEMVVVMAPAVLTFFSLLYYKSRETVYKVWLGYTLLGLLAFAFLNMVMGDYLYSDEKLYFWNLGGIYVVGSILIWLYGVVAHFFKLRTEVEIKLEELKKKLPLYIVWVLALGTVLSLIKILLYRFWALDFSIFGLHHSTFIILLIMLTSVFLPLALLHSKSSDTTYKIWLSVSAVAFMIFIPMLLLHIEDSPAYSRTGSLYSTQFLWLGIIYFGASIVIRLSEIPAPPNDTTN